MSLIVEMKPSDMHTEVGGLSTVLSSLATSVMGLAGGSNTKQIINGTSCKGILQNDISISFTNNWKSTAYQGITSGITSLSKQKLPMGASLNAIKTLYDFATTGLNMGGVSMVGAGAATTRIYEGSAISGFNVMLKWYTPYDNTYVDSLKALMILGFPSFRNAVNKGNTGTSTISSALAKIPLVGPTISSTYNTISNTLSTLLSYNPPPVTLTITSNGTTVFKLYPLIITNISFNFSRETFKGIPIVISATVSYEFYQVYGNNGYPNNDFKLAGVPLLGKLEPTTSK